MAWQPVPDSLRQLAVCLKDSLSGFNKTVQKQAEQMLAQAKTSPDINNYLAYIFSSPTPPDGLQFSPEEYHIVRSAAAIMLKNNVKVNFKQIPETSLGLIKMAVPIGIQDKNPQIRNYAGNIATELIRRCGLMSWPEILPDLLNLAANESGHVPAEAQEGAMAALAKISEDNFKMLERKHGEQPPLNFLLPKFIEVTKSELPKVRVNALVAINTFAPRRTQAMLNQIDNLLQHLFVLASDNNPDVRRQVCRAFVQLVEARPDKLVPHIGNLVDYILTQQKSDDEDLACEAAEFWLAVGEHENLWHSLQPHIQKIIPVLLESMVYSGEDIALLGGASDDEDEDDREEDIKPAFHKKQQARNINTNASANGSNSADPAENGNAYQKLADLDGDLEDGEVETLEDGDDGDPEERWTIRKCSAAALDVFARDFQSPVFESILPYLTNHLKHGEWPYREAAVLALGAVADGCIDAVTPHLPELIPYLLTLLEDPEPVVRQITCWTLGRYSSWAASLENPTDRDAFFMPIMDGILRKMLDRNKKVQEAGASAFANLEDKAGKVLQLYSGPIIQQFVRCFAKYKDRNMYILYDCVQTLAEQIGPVLAQPEHANQLMPALINRYNAVTDQSRELFPLLECFSYVSVALGDSFSPYAQPIFQRCVNIIHTNLEQSLASRSNTAVDSPDKDFLVTTLDLLSAMIQALDNDKAAELVKGSQTPFFELLGYCMDDPADEVRQSAYALLGDCAKSLYPQLGPALPSLMGILLKQLDLDSILDEEIDAGFAVVNNACWSVGEISIAHKQGMTPYVPELLQRLLEIGMNPRVPRSVHENASLALGRLGLDNYELLAPALPSFAEEFLESLDDVDPSEEKATAFKGFTHIVCHNPQAMEKTLLHYFTSIARYQELELQSPIKQELHDVFQNAIDIYKQLMPQFHEFIAQMQPGDLEALKTNYSI